MLFLNSIISKVCNFTLIIFNIIYKIYMYNYFSLYIDLPKLKSFKDILIYPWWNNTKYGSVDAISIKHRISNFLPAISKGFSMYFWIIVFTSKSTFCYIPSMVFLFFQSVENSPWWNCFDDIKSFLNLSMSLIILSPFP